MIREGHVDIGDVFFSFFNFLAALHLACGVLVP